jgi:hypothetical protein
VFDERARSSFVERIRRLLEVRPTDS